MTGLMSKCTLPASCHAGGPCNQSGTSDGERGDNFNTIIPHGTTELTSDNCFNFCSVLTAGPCRHGVRQVVAHPSPGRHTVTSLLVAYESFRDEVSVEEEAKDLVSSIRSTGEQGACVVPVPGPTPRVS